jgi:alginate O-acetyltransferase complex protein AlgI
MLFNSHEFILIFIPLVLSTLFFVRKVGHNYYISILIFYSFIFYLYWNIYDLILILISILANFIFANIIIFKKNKYLLVAFIVLNLLVLIYFKYFIFFLSLIGIITDKKIDLPLGISFFTFTQIVLLIDIYSNKVKEIRFNNFVLFVVYFPHLIAGPLLHYKDLTPQFQNDNTKYLNKNNILIGIVIFTIGLAKKVLLADNFAPYVNLIFYDYNTKESINSIYAWTGAVAYSMQLYFDFSGYTDMAIGISKMLNINLPINFNSPYKSKNIIDFWRRWHITLSNLLRDYLYIPLGGNKNRFISVFITMILGGLWHGASLTFLLWGLIHGILIYLNYIWIEIKRLFKISDNFIPDIIAIAITFLCVTFAWVFFRADNINSGIRIINDMCDFFKLILNYETFNSEIHKYISLIKEANLSIRLLILLLVSSCIIIWKMPSTYSFINNENNMIKFTKSYFQIIFFSILFLISVLSIKSKKEFLYFNF